MIHDRSAVLALYYLDLAATPNQTLSQFKILNARYVDCLTSSEVTRPRPDIETISEHLKEMAREDSDHSDLSRREKMRKSEKRKFGKIELILGPMFSGKSTELMRRLKRYQVLTQSL